MGIEQYRKNGLSAGSRLPPVPAALPLSQGRQTPYFAANTRAFLRERARYADNLYEAQIQGMDPDNPMGLQWYRIRVEDVINNSAVTSNMYEGWKMVFFEDPGVEAMPRGVKLFFGGSTWISINPNDLGSPAANGIIRRCDAVWGKLDYYGNPVYVPFVREKEAAKATDNSYGEHTVLAKHYHNCIMARDANSRDLHENTRIILGTSAFTVTGLNDSSRDYTDDPDSVTLMYFSIYRQEPTENDDMERQIADARSFSWEIAVSGAPDMIQGRSQILTASSVRCGEAPDGEHPVSYLWESGDEGVVRIGPDGTAEAVAPGTAEITCRLEQNPDISAVFPLSVREASQEPAISFAAQPPRSLAQYQSATLRAAVYENGQETGDPVAYSAGGPDQSCYGMTENGDGTVTVTCYYPSYTPLTVTARSGDLQVSAEIALNGF